MNTDTYLLIRTYPLKRVEQAMGEEANLPMVIDKLNLINNNSNTPLQVSGIYTSNYPATFTIREGGKHREVEVWVKETRVGYDTPIPYLILNEGKVLNTIVKDMINKRRSPHFVYPLVQLVTNDKEGSSSHISIYNVMECFPHADYNTYLNHYDVKNHAESFGLVTGIFQILYNLTVMENLRWRHNDLHPRNIKIDTKRLFRSTYIIDDKTAYNVPSTCFLVFTGWERSLVKTASYSSIPIPERQIQLPDGTVEDAWETWNPYYDLITFWSSVLGVMGKNTEMLNILFGGDGSILEDLKRLTAAKTPQSIGELRVEFQSDQDLLDRCRPGNLLKRFANQFFTPVDPTSVADGIVFSVL